MENNPLEKDIQNTICKYLKAKKYFFWRNNNIPVYGRNNAGAMTFRSMGKYTMKGLPDIIIILNGIFIGVEVKRVGIKKLRPDQEIFQKLCIDNKTHYFVVHSLEQLLQYLQYLEDIYLTGTGL